MKLFSDTERSVNGKFSMFRFAGVPVIPESLPQFHLVFRGILTAAGRCRMRFNRLLVVFRSTWITFVPRSEVENAKFTFECIKCTIIDATDSSS